MRGGVWWAPRLYVAFLLAVLVALIIAGHPAAATAWAIGTNFGYVTRWMLDKINGKNGKR